MNIANKALINGFAIPVVGKGTWMTSSRKKNHIHFDDAARIENIKAGLDQGMTYIDTAERYANGREEILIGHAIKGYERNNLFLTSKISSKNLAYDEVISSVKASIKRMRGSYLDLCLIHQYNSKIPLKKTIKAMDYLIEKKLIKNIGVCDFTIAQLQEIQAHTKNKIVANQLRYNLTFRDPEQQKIIEYCQKNDIMIIAWRPWEQALMNEKTKKLLDELSSKYRKTPMQIALTWLLSQANIVVLTKMNTEKQQKEVADAFDFTIVAEDLKRLTLSDATLTA